MSGSAPKKIQGISTRENDQVVHIPTEEESWRTSVTGHAQKVVPSYTAKQATPPASHPIPGSDALEQVKAERVGEEPEISFSDIRHGVSTLGTAVGGVAPDTYDRTTSENRKIISFVKERARRLFRKKAA